MFGLRLFLRWIIIICMSVDAGSNPIPCESIAIVEIVVSTNVLPGTSVYTLYTVVAKRKKRQISDAVSLSNSTKYFELHERTTYGASFWDLKVTSCLDADFSETLALLCNGVGEKTYIGPTNFAVSVYPTKPDLITVETVIVDVFSCKPETKLEVHTFAINNHSPCVSFTCNVNYNETSAGFYAEGTTIYALVDKINISRSYNLTVSCTESNTSTVNDEFRANTTFMVEFFNRCGVWKTITTGNLTAPLSSPQESRKQNAEASGFFDDTANVAAISTVAGLLGGVIASVGVHILIRKYYRINPMQRATG